MRRFNRKGFTLIELLVVIGIIVVLSSLLYPVFSQTRDMSMQTVCLSNIRQLVQSVFMYVRDNDDKLPCMLSEKKMISGDGLPPIPTRYKGYWIGIKKDSHPNIFDDLKNYIRNDSIKVCPLDTRASIYGLYSYDSMLIDINHNSYVTDATRLSHITSPSGTTLFIELGWNHTPITYNSDPAPDGQIYGAIGAFHSIAFCDGNVRSLPVINDGMPGLYINGARVR